MREDFEEAGAENETPDEVSDEDFASEHLDIYRPQRYESRDKRWQEPVIDLLAERLSSRPDDVKAVVRELARRRVHDVEANATRRVKSLLRRLGTGQEVLGGEGFWREMMTPVLPAPVAYLHRKLNNQGKMVHIHMRSRFGEMRDEDIVEAIDTMSQIKSAGDVAFAETVEGWRRIRDFMMETGMSRPDVIVSSYGTSED